MRRIVTLSIVGAVALSAVVAHAQPADQNQGPGMRMWERLCSGTTDRAARPDMTERLGQRLALTDPQKGFLKDLSDARQASRTDMKTAVCAQKPDMTSPLSRLDFRTKLLETRLAAMKAQRPKLEAFYNSLDDKQKANFEDSVRRMRSGRFEDRREDMERRDMERGGDRARRDDRDGYGPRGGREDRGYGDHGYGDRGYEDRGYGDRGRMEDWRGPRFDHGPSQGWSRDRDEDRGGRDRYGDGRDDRYDRRGNADRFDDDYGRRPGPSTERSAPMDDQD